MGWIYWLRFPNGKGYVGQTRRPIAARMRKHRQRAKQGKRNEALYNAWRKHGAPECVPLIECSDNELNAREKDFIAAFRTRAPHGYNSTDGGDCDLANARERLRAPEVREKIAGSVRSLWADEGYRANMSRAHKGKPAINRGARNAAKARGITTYETGRPCLRGHVAPRYTSTGICTVCLRAREGKRR